MNSWDRHVDGALALTELRGTGQLRNRVGRSIFLSLRTEVVSLLEPRKPLNCSDANAACQLS
jgi:hypothetical protein